MGMSLDRIFAQPYDGQFGVTIVSNEDDGRVSYAHGRIELIKGGVKSPTEPGVIPDQIVSQEMPVTFSDKIVPGPSRQPFDVAQAVTLTLRINPGLGTSLPTADLRIASESINKSHFALTPMSDLSVGVGPRLLGTSPSAVYTFAFYSWPTKP